MNKTTALQTKKGSYLLNPKYAPTGSNLVEFEMRGTQVKINHSTWRNGTPSEIAFLQNILKIIS